jgi:hypothetical protein
MGPIMGGVARFKFDPATVAITFDGNSLVDQNYSDLAAQLQALPPLNGQFTIANKGISGQTIANMAGSAGDVDAAWVAGKTNVLLLWEITNSIFVEGKTGLQACAELSSYIAARKAVHPWIVVLMTCIPRGDFFGSGTWDATTGEVQLQSANTYLRNNYKAMGARALVEMRQGPFAFTDSANGANFPPSLWTDRTHPNSAGKAYCAQYIADVLKRLPAR